MKHIIYITILGIFSLFIINSITVDTVSARPGGGHSYKKSKKKSRSNSYSSDKKSSSNSYYDRDTDSDDDSESEEEAYVFDWENIDYEFEFSNDNSSGANKAWIFLVFVVFFGSFYAFMKYKEKERKKQQLVSKPTPENKRRKIKRTINNLSKLMLADPNFSQTLFMDFVSSVFTKYKSLLGEKEFVNLAPFVSPDDIEYAESYPEKVSEVVIGSASITNITIKNNIQNIFVEIDANYTTTCKKDVWTARYAVVEKWKFSRKAGILSPEPEKMRELSCPSCGANSGFTSVGKCESCGIKIENGEKQWYLSSHKLITSDSFKTDNLAYYADEYGTELATIYQSTLSKNTEDFAKNHNIKWDVWSNKFKNTVVHNYFTKLYSAWSIKKLGTVRNLLSDRLYESWMFWIDNYTKEGLTNKLDDVKIQKTEFVKLEADKFYESATIRIKALCKDYVLDKSGKLAGGSKRKNRKFSEYWTFIRRNGVENDDYDISTCPNCGAPADKMGQVGICEYCNTKISNGDFSWVLAVITQDEVYKG